MRLVMIRIILRSINAHPNVVPSCFVDDVSAEMTGSDDYILKELGGFISHVGKSFAEAEMELSKTKSVCTAFTEALGKRVEELWKDLCVTL